jgi:hypothetical protein
MLLAAAPSSVDWHDFSALSLRPLIHGAVCALEVGSEYRNRDAQALRLARPFDDNDPIDNFKLGSFSAELVRHTQHSHIATEPRTDSASMHDRAANTNLPQHLRLGFVVTESATNFGRAVA